MLHNLSILIGLSLLLTLSVSKYHTLFKIWISVKALHNTDMLYVQICTFFVSNNFLKNNCSDPRRGSCNSEVSILHHFQIDSYKADNCKKKDDWTSKELLNVLSRKTEKYQKTWIFLEQFIQFIHQKQSSSNQQEVFKSILG